MQHLKPKSQDVNNKRVVLTHPMTLLSCDEDYITVTQTHWFVRMKTFAARQAGTVTNYELKQVVANGTVPVTTIASTQPEK